MYQRKESVRKYILTDGTVIEARLLDGILIEDVMMQHAKAYAFQVRTGIEKRAIIGRDFLDPLIRLYTIN